MHKGWEPQEDSRENSSGKGSYAGSKFDRWKILWRPPGQTHWSCIINIIGHEAAVRIEKRLIEEGHKPYRYRI